MSNIHLRFLFSKFFYSLLLLVFCLNLPANVSVPAETSQLPTYPHDQTPLEKSYLDCPCPQIIAHRGASGSFPDSSLLAFEKALDLHTDILELDVHFSNDQHIIVSHDETLLRTTGKNILIAKEKLKHIKQHDVGYTFSDLSGAFPFRGQGLEVLTLDELVKHFPNARFNIEIKPDDPELARALANFVKKHQLVDRVVVASKHTLALESYRKYAPETALTSANLNEIVLAFLKWFYKGDLRQEPYQLLQIPYKFTNKSLVDYFHRNGKVVHVWTVNHEQDIRRMLQIGVDGVMTDFPERAYPIYVEFGLRQGTSE